MANAKNELLEWLQGQGFTPDWGAMLTSVQVANGWQTTLQHRLPNGVMLSGRAVRTQKKQAEFAACAEALVDLRQYDRLMADMRADAQAGDALIKLAAYSRMESDPARRSRWLQWHESNAYLATVFERWWRAGDPDVRSYGLGLGKVSRATVVEALIWRRFGRHLQFEGHLAKVIDVLHPE